MQAILKVAHRQFCSKIQEIRSAKTQPTDELLMLESELCAIFEVYQQRLHEFRLLLDEYDAKKKTIQKILKQLTREEITNREYKIFGR